MIKLNPNVITLKKKDPTAKIWHKNPVSLDSLVALCRPFVIYTEPDRECEFLIDSITNICERKDFNVIKEDLYIQPHTNASLVMMRTDTTMSWQGERISPREKMIQDCIKTIKNTPQWYEPVKQKAIEQNIPLESMLRRDAIWSIEHQQ